MADALWSAGRPESTDLPLEEERQLDAGRCEPDGTPSWMMGMGGRRRMRGGRMGMRGNRDSDNWLNDPSDHMRRFCVPRHSKEKLNVVFMDGMVETISPKELWRLKWHKTFDTSAPLPEWPEWMHSFKEPD